MTDPTSESSAPSSSPSGDHHLRAILDCANDIIFAMSTKGIIISVNSSFQTVTGWLPSDWIGKPFKPLVHPDDIPQAERAFAAARAGHGVGSTQIRVIKKWGDYVVLDGTLVPEMSDGQVVQIIGVARDLTEKLAAEEQRIRLKQEETLRHKIEGERERAIFLSNATASLFASLDRPPTAVHLAEIASGLADWVIVALTNEDRGVVDIVAASANTARQSLILELTPLLAGSLSPVHPLHQSLTQGQPVTLPDVTLADLNRLTDHPEHRRLLVKLGLFSCASFPIRSRNKIFGAIFLASSERGQKLSQDDLSLASEFSFRAAVAVENHRLYWEIFKARDALSRSQQQLAQARDQAVEHSRFKSELAAHLSHEIRTPINALIGVADLLTRSNLPRMFETHIDIIHGACSTLLSLVNDILDLSKAESGQLTMALEDFSSLNVLESVLELFAAPAEAKKIDLVAVVDPTLPSQLRGDGARLRQILLNLVSNAVKFTPKGTVRLEAQVERVDEKQLTVRFDVSDTGVGIPPDKLSMVFEPFRQIQSGGKSAEIGTGLGLSIARQFTNLMKGELSVTSLPGAGATFSCRIPFPISGPEATPPELGRLSALSVLVADPHPGRRTAVLDQLKKWKVHHCQGVETSEGLCEVLTAAQTSEKPFDAVLTDLPLWKGHKAASPQQLFRQPKFKKTRVAGLLPLSIEPANQVLGATGMTGVLFQPLRPSALQRWLLGENSRFENARPEARETSVVENGPRMLVAEDNLLNQRALSLQLKELGCRMELAEGGLTAIEAAQKSSFDLILMDVEMPDLDGLRATERIRQSNGPSAHVPIVALTAHVEPDMKDRCRLAGMNDCLMKPVSLEDLQNLLVRWVKGVEAPAPASPKLLSSHQREMNGLFLTMTPHSLKKLTIAVGHRRYRQIEMEAHRLAGSCGTLGFRAMLDGARQLESLARKRTSMGALRTVLAGLKHSYKELEPTLKKNEHGTMENPRR